MEWQLFTHRFNAGGLTSVEFRNATPVGDSHAGLDNVSLTAVPTGGGGAVIPEPATWAMLIVGFGLVGATLRRRDQLGVSA